MAPLVLVCWCQDSGSSTIKGRRHVAIHANHILNGPGCIYTAAGMRSVCPVGAGHMGSLTMQACCFCWCRIGCQGCRLTLAIVQHSVKVLDVTKAVAAQLQAVCTEAQAIVTNIKGALPAGAAPGCLM